MENKISLLHEAYEWWEYGISQKENDRLFKKYYPNEPTGYPRFFMDTDKLRIYCLEKGIEHKPKLICYCGSLRFIDKFKEAEYQTVIDGNIALLPCCMFVDIQRECGEVSDYKTKADELHKRKIDICDEVFVLNVEGYIGNSTRSEIDYAIKIGKPVKYLEQ